MGGNGNEKLFPDTSTVEAADGVSTQLLNLEDYSQFFGRRG